MRPSSLPVPAILDDAVALVTQVAAPWLGVLWLLSLPVRLAQAHLVARVHALGDEAQKYGDHLGWLALLTTMALVLSLLARAAFVTACSRRLRGIEAGEGPRFPSLGAIATYVYVALALEVAFYLTCASFVLAPLFVVLAGLAAAALPQEDRASLVRPLGILLELTREARPLVGLLGVFTVAFVIVLTNLYLLFRAGVWLAGGVVGADVSRWVALLDLGNTRFVCLLVAVSVVALEPWWLGALVVFVHRKRSLSTGEDLRLWFARIREGKP